MTPLIALDARTIYQPVRRGTGKNLIDLYRSAAALRPSWQFLMFHRAQGGDDPFAGLANVRARVIEIPGDRWNLWQQVRLPLAARRARASVLHCPANTAPHWPLGPMIITIHDFIALEEPFRQGGWAAEARNMARAARLAKRIITPSEYTKGQILQRVGVAADKIVVSPWAPDAGCQAVRDPAILAAARGAYGLDAERPYVLAFGAADARKNTAGVLRAWSLLPAELRRSAQILVIGIGPKALDEFRRQTAALGIEAGCRLTGFAPQQDVPALLSGAAVMCYPSLSEGFGLPVLDAFACGTAVLTSSTTSLPEVAGDAALLVDPADPAAIAAGLERLLTEPALRRELASRGTERLKLYSWARCAQRFCGVLDDVLA